MAVFFITRHQGARDWAARHGHSDATIIEHLSDAHIAALGEGDAVIGTLPVHIAAQVSARDARYLHLEMTIPHEARGRDLSADEMQAFGAHLTEYEVERIA